MSTLGNATTPTTPTYGWINSGTHMQVADSYTVPAGGGLFSSISFWAAGSGTLTIHGVIWDSSGTVLAFGPGVSTSGGAGSGVGATAWNTDTLSTPVFIAGGTTIYIGWQCNSAASTYWAYNGNITSPSTQWNTPSGSSGQSFSGHATQSPAGIVAAYATYTPGGIYVNTGTPASPVWTPAELSVNTGTPASPVWTPANGLYVNTGTPASPVWTPTN